MKCCHCPLHHVEVHASCLRSSSSLQSVHSTTVATQRGPILTNTALHVLRLCGRFVINWFIATALAQVNQA